MGALLLRVFVKQREMLAAEWRQRPWRLLARGTAVVWLLVVVAVVVSPWWERTDTYGFHDWDVITSFRYLTKVALLEDGEFPGYNPYACGGYPLWGYVEGATNLVTPWLPAYLWLPLPLALRVEATGMALIGAVGAYRLARLFTKSRAAALLVVAVWAVNGRWALQVAAGHAWHLSYALLPWSILFYERWRRPEARLRQLCGLSIALAWMVYAGGIYPLPHAVLALGLYAALLCWSERSLRPAWALASAGIVALGLAAPKLLPILDTFSGDPRLIASTEQLSLGAFITLLTHPDQAFGARPAAVRPYGWHEWGMYISTAGAVLIALGLLRLKRGRERMLALVGGVLLVLGFGAFHPSAPWVWLHRHMPVFRSQHVPSRFLYPALLLLAVPAAAGLGRIIERRMRRWRWLDAAAVALIAVVALDVAQVARQPMKQAMWLEPPAIPSGRPFHHQVHPPFQYKKRDWAGPMLLSMMANTGVLKCYGVPTDPARPPAPLPRGHAHYHGESYLLGGGHAKVVARTPNRIEVDVTEAAADATLVINLHHHKGWHVRYGDTEQPATAHKRLLAGPARNGRVTFRYRPPGLAWGLLCFFVTLAGLLWQGLRRGPSRRWGRAR